MKKRPSSTARTLAVLALAAAFVVLIVVVSAALNDNGSESTANGHSQQVHQHQEAEVQKKVPATYLIKSGDTLTAIAHATGVSVAKIERLNPEVDPQILIAGEKLKLR
jgi:LysM repeat protein